MPNPSAAKQVMLRHGWLSGMPRAFQQRVIGQCQYARFKPGEQIYNVGDPPGGMFGFVSGGVVVEIAPAERGPYVANLMLPGQWFGEISALSGQNRRVGMKATRETEVLYLPLASIKSILAEDSEAWRRFYLITVGHFDTAVALSDDLMRRGHVDRFVATLLHLSGERAATSVNESTDIDVRQEELASIANVARTTAGKILRDLQQAGHIELSYRRIRLLEPDALRAMLNA